MDGDGGWGLQKEAQPHIPWDGSYLITPLSLRLKEAAGLMVASPLNKSEYRGSERKKMCSQSHSKAVTEQVAS